MNEPSPVAGINTYLSLWSAAAQATQMRCKCGTELHNFIQGRLGRLGAVRPYR